METNLDTHKLENHEFFEKVRALEQLLARIERIEYNQEANGKRLDSALKELRGLIAMVRPAAKRNAWYGEEISAEANNQTLLIESNQRFTNERFVDPFTQ